MSTVNGGGNIITDGLVLYLDAANIKSYIGSGTTWSDLTINGNNGALVNMGTTGFSSSNLGTIVFDGVDDYVNLGNNFNFQYNNSFTLCGWFNFTNDQDSTLIAKQDNTGNFRGYIMRKLVNYQLSFGLVSTVGLQVQIRTPTNVILPNIWYYISSTYDGTSLSSGLKIFINGNQLSTTTVANTLGNNTIITNANAAIGKFGLTSIISPFNGKNSVTQIYNKVLNASEILQNYNTMKSRFGLT